MKYLTKYLFFFIAVIISPAKPTYPVLDSFAHSDFNSSFNFDHYTTKQGLSQNTIYAIEQDSKGFLWFGTQGGVNRFNGYEFKVFGNSTFDTTSLPHTYVNQLFEDSKGRMWVCTEGGLSLFNPLTESFKNFNHDESNPQSIIDNYVWTIFEDSKGTFWVGTKKGLSRFEPEKNTFEFINIFSGESDKINAGNVTGIFEDNNNDLWVIPRGRGIFKINRKNSNPIIESDLIVENYKPGNGDVRSIIQDSYGDIFIGIFGEGLFKFDIEKKSFNNIPVNPSNTASINPKFIRTLFYDPVNPNILWLGTEEDGIIRVNIKTNNSVKIINDPKNPDSFKGTMVYSIYRDRSGLMWIGSDEGINLLNLNSNKFEHIQKTKDNVDGLNNNKIGKMIEDRNGIMWIGTDGGGLNKFDRSLNKFTHYMNSKNDPSSISSNRAMIVFEDHSGTIWVGTYGGGLNKFDRANGNSKAYTFINSDTTSLGSDYVTSIVEDDDGYLWIGTTSGGLNRFDKNTEKFQRFLNDPNDPESISENHIWVLYIDKNGVLWAGTKNSGLNEMIDINKGKFKRYLHDNKNEKSINSNTIYEIYEDRKMQFWVGTLAGLNKLDRKTGEFTDFRFKEVVTLFAVIGIMEDQHDLLWIITGNELFRFNSRTNASKIYDNRNGLMVSDLRLWANYKNSKGEMIVGGANGFAIFHPDSLKDNSFIPPVVIDKFERYNTDNPTSKAIAEKGIAYRDNLELSYKDNIFSFSFAALNYINPAKNQYAYKLEGFNKDWIYVGSKRQVTFTNIDPGTYTFRVKGSNDDAVWNENDAQLSITISPPIWETWWFRLGVLLSIIFIVVSYVKSKLSEAERRNKEQEAFARQLIETEELERQRIANELHDGLGQNLLVIKNSILLRQQQNKMDVDSLSDMSELVSHTIQEVRTISHNLRPHLLDQLGITKTIKSLAKQLSETSGIKISVEIDDLNNALDPKAEINLFRVIQESFNNIIKHSEASKLEVLIKRHSGLINISIRDNGKGMDLDLLKNDERFGQGFGLNGMERRAHIFGWTYEIISQINIGTTIKINIPIKRDVNDESD